MFRQGDLSEFVGKFYYEGKRRKQYLVRFGVLTVLSTVIASYGILADSTATVIGAMIIAPLMTPIMAVATALVMGRIDRATRSLITTVLGALAVVLVSMFIAETYFGFISLETNSQITSRVAPNITDLFVALAAGAVAAFAMSRENVSDSLPGVAIAIALVPPLAVAGICLSVGNVSMASGAFLLFLTNLLSIIVAGALVLHLLGLSKYVIKDLDGKALRNAFIVIGIGMFLVILPLLFISQETVNAEVMRKESQEIVKEWVSDSGYRLAELNIANENIDIIIAGTGAMPDFDVLVKDLQTISDDEIMVKLAAVESQYQVHPKKNDDEKAQTTNE